MKLLYSLIFLSLISVSSFSQDKKDIAKIYFKKALKSYNDKDLEKTEHYLEKTIVYFEGIETEEIAIFGAKFFFEKQNYNKAKEYLGAFFKFNEVEKSENYNDMLFLYTDTLDAIDDPDSFKKVNRRVMPNVITDKVKNGSNSLVENKLLNEEVEESVQPKDVSFLIIENVPVFPGCSGSKKELKECFSKMVQVHFSNNFNADLPNTLGLVAGKKRVFIGFLINREGKVVDIMVRAPHPLLKDEVIRVMKLLPEMKPGTQRGKNVNVKYSIPFTLNVG